MNGSLIDEFAKVVQDRVNLLDVEECSEKFAQIASEKAIQIYEKTGPSDSEFADLELEAKLWSLVEALSTVQTSQSTGFSQDDANRITHTVLKWLRDSLTSPSKPNDLPINKWRQTNIHLRSMQGSKHSANSSTVSLLVNELDLDAPIRQNRAIATEDAEADSVTFRYVFGLLIAGKYKEAVEVCESTKNWLLKSAIVATSALKQGEAETQDVSLIRRACYAVSQTTSLGKYERAVYGLMSGDIATVLPLCSDWETYLLAHVNSLAILGPAKSSDFEPSSTLNRLPGPTRTVKSVGDAINMVENCADHKIVLQGQEYHRQIMKALIFNRLDDFVDEVVAKAEADLAVGGSSAQSNDLLRMPWLLRILLHLVILTRHNVANPGPSYDFLMRSYVEYLLLERNDMYIPSYVRLLKPEAQLEIYPRVLAHITDSSEREQQLRLVRSQGPEGLDIKKNILGAIRLVIQNTALPEPLKWNVLEAEKLGDTAPVTRDDERLLNSLEWLVESGIWDEAVSALVDMSRIYLTAGQPLVVLDLVRRLSEALLPSRVDINSEERQEALEYEKLATAFRHIQAWDSLEKDSNDWRTKATEYVGAVIDSTRLALSFMAVQSKTSEILAKLRTIYVPFIIFEVLRILKEAQAANKGYLNFALELSPLIADEKGRLYELFDASNQLPRLLQTFADIMVDQF